MASSGPPESQRFVVPLGVSLLGILLLGTVLLFGAFALEWPIGLSVNAIEEAIRSWGAWGALASIGLMILHSFVPYPAEVIAIANGMAYGTIWGTDVTWTGAMLVAGGLVLWFIFRRKLLQMRRKLRGRGVVSSPSSASGVSDP